MFHNNCFNCTTESVPSIGSFSQAMNLLTTIMMTSSCLLSASDKWPKDFGPQLVKRKVLKFDFIVVGAGSAGSVVANRLSKDYSVLLLEAGGDPPVESEIPAYFIRLLNDPSYTWQYRTEKSVHACLALRDGRCSWPRGKLLGGCSSLNAMIYVRGNTADYDNWSRVTSSSNWSWPNVLSTFKDLEDLRYLRNGEPNNPIKLDSYQDTLPLKETIFTAASELGHAQLKPLNEDAFLGFHSVPGTLDYGTRSSSAKCFLSPIKDRPNLKVIKHAMVDMVQGKTVKFFIGNSSFKARAKKEIILSAGTVGTPQILQRSGIGPKHLLDALKIPLLVNSPVGRNLQDHIVVPMYFRITGYESQPPTLRQTLTTQFEYLMHRTGPLSTIEATDAAGFISTTKSQYPDIQFIYMYFPRGAHDLYEYLRSVDYTDSISEFIINISNSTDIFITYVCLLNPKSTGFIEITGKHHQDAPKIVTNYLTHSDDVTTLLAGIREKQRFLSTTAFKSNGITDVLLPICKDFDPDSDEYWICYMRHVGITVYHPTGTARMGVADDENSVVDDKLKVKGVTGLRVIDASIMPAITSGNTNAPTMMIGQKGSEMILDEWA